MTKARRIDGFVWLDGRVQLLLDISHELDVNTGVRR